MCNLFLPIHPACNMHFYPTEFKSQFTVLERWETPTWRISSRGRSEWSEQVEGWWEMHKWWSANSQTFLWCPLKSNFPENENYWLLISGLAGAWNCIYCCPLKIQGEIQPVWWESAVRSFALRQNIIYLFMAAWFESNFSVLCVDLQTSRLSNMIFLNWIKVVKVDPAHWGCFCPLLS